MNKADEYYINNLEDILTYGDKDQNPRPKYKDGTPAHSYFITQVFEKYDISQGEFPITTLRNTATKMGIAEMIWIYQKQSNSLADAHDLGITWWDEWDIGNLTIGQRYGATVKEYNLIDNLLKGLIENPYGRRHIMNLYQEEHLKSKGLHPCAYETLWSVRGKYLDLTLNQRSNDYIMAGYINKIQYVALQMMIANHVGLKPGYFCHFVQNLHIYDRHIDAAREILKRTPLGTQPKLRLDKRASFYDYQVDDFIVEGNKGIKKLESELEIAV